MQANTSPGHPEAERYYIAGLQSNRRCYGIHPSGAGRSELHPTEALGKAAVPYCIGRVNQGLCQSPRISTASRCWEPLRKCWALFCSWQPPTRHLLMRREGAKFMLIGFIWHDACGGGLPGAADRRPCSEYLF